VQLGREFGQNRTTKPSRSQERQALAVVGESHEFCKGQIPQLFLKKKEMFPLDMLRKQTIMWSKVVGSGQQ
jgi:hypothetical protein